jgi:hypothetical protein
MHTIVHARAPSSGWPVAAMAEGFPGARGLAEIADLDQGSPSRTERHAARLVNASEAGSTMGRTEEGKVTVVPHSRRKSRKNGCDGEKPRLRRRFSRNFARNIH